MRESEPRASLLRLPIELRVEIYKYVIASFYRERLGSYWWGDDYKRGPRLVLTLPGSSPYGPPDETYRRDGNGTLPLGHGPGLPDVAGRGGPLLDAIDFKDILFNFEYFTEEEMRRWVTLPSAGRRSGEERVRSMRTWSIDSWGYCEAVALENACDKPWLYEDDGDYYYENNYCHSDLAGGQDFHMSWRQAKELGLDGYCSRHVYVDFSMFIPRLGNDDLFEDKSVYRKSLCMDRSANCERATEDSVRRAWNTFDCIAWKREGEPPVTPELLINLHKALGVPSKP
ncbi:hypothetical protein PG990_007540 [Apiospora arundinis]